MPTPEQVHEAIRRYAKAVSAADREAILACFDDNATVVDPYPGPPHTGTAEIGSFWDQVMALGKPVAFLPEKTVVCADRATFLFGVEVISGGVPMSITGFEVISVNDDGLITELTAYWDPSTIGS